MLDKYTSVITLQNWVRLCKRIAFDIGQTSLSFLYLDYKGHIIVEFQRLFWSHTTKFVRVTLLSDILLKGQFDKPHCIYITFLIYYPDEITIVATIVIIYTFYRETSHHKNDPNIIIIVNSPCWKTEVICAVNQKGS